MTRWVPTTSALADLQDIHSYGEQTWGERRARDYVEDLYQIFDLLAFNPGIGVRRPELGEGIRAVPQGSHMVFYRPMTDRIIVARVLHGAMDHASILAEYDPLSDVGR